MARVPWEYCEPSASGFTLACNGGAAPLTIFVALIFQTFPETHWIARLMVVGALGTESLVVVRVVVIRLVHYSASVSSGLSESSKLNSKG